MKILHIINHYYSNATYQENYMLKEHVKSGFKTYIISSSHKYPHPDYKNTVGKLYENENFDTGIKRKNKITVIRLKSLFNWRTRMWFFNFHTTIKRINPDIVISHSILDINTIRILFRSYKFRWLIDEHQLPGQVDQSRIGKLFYFIFRILFKNLLINKADKIIAISEGCVHTLEKYFNIPKNKISLIPLGADSEKFIFDKNKCISFRKNYSIDYNSIVITYTGKLYEEKKAHLIIEALNLLNIQKKIHLLFVGSPTLEYKLKFNEILKSIKYSHTILPMQGQDGLIEVFCASDIAVWPGAATISTLEASSCGIPIICDKVLSERFKNNNGIGIEYGNVEELAEALNILINNDKLRKTMGRNGREYIEKELSWKILTERFIA